MPEEPNWNPNYDLNDDNKIDASDLFDLSKNYEKPYDSPSENTVVLPSYCQS